ITYLDHGGATLYAHSQINHFYQDLAENIYGNPHSANVASRLTHDTIERVRYRILQHFNTSPEEYTIIFTSGSTAALKLVAETRSQGNGLGALLVKNESGHMLRKRYFGGGTAASYLSGEDFYVPKQSISDRFEDGTISFLDIIAVNHGFDALDKFTGGMQNIMAHTFSLARYTYIILSGMRHANGTPVSQIYSDNEFETPDAQGPIINMNVLDEKGGIVGYAKVDKLANLYNIHLRTGCFCNTGGCQQHLGISDEDVKKNLQAGHVCGDSLDLIDGRPTGSVRISFGYMSTFDDAQTFLKFIINCFIKQPVSFDKGTLSKLTQCGTMKESDESCAENFTDGKAKKIASEIAVAHNSARTEVPLYQNSSDNQSELNKNSTTSKLIYYDSEPITLANIYLYPIKSCAAFEVRMKFSLLQKR
ncbi:hypothetical protein scyTo_0014432, partial [Scyliorhinus torazame]|nr:hypothetical protein [Scyliorhinus torazame]